MKIGTVKKRQRVRIALKNWIKDNWREGEQRELPIIRIFTPGRFPSYSLICLDRENGVEVSKSLTETTGKELLKQFNFSVKKETPGTLYLFIKPDGSLEVEKIPERDKVYVFTGSSFALVDKSQNQQKTKEIDEDLPF